MLLVTIEYKADSVDDENRMEKYYLSQNQAETVKKSICTIGNEGKEDKMIVIKKTKQEFCHYKAINSILSTVTSNILSHCPHQYCILETVSYNDRSTSFEL